MKISVSCALLALSYHVNFCLGVVIRSATTTTVHVTNDNTTFEGSIEPGIPATDRQLKWANSAYDFIQTIDCASTHLTGKKECKTLQTVAKAEMNLYVADPTSRGKLEAILPDGGLRKTGRHDAVLVLDPYPRANFGHLVIVFYIDLERDKEHCSMHDGIYLEGGECLVAALKRRCRNLLKRRRRRKNYSRRCEINFLPLVHLSSESRRPQQRLVCRNAGPEFASCPSLRSINDTSHLFCNPLRENSKRCETSHESIQTSCRVFETCDQAVVLSGGWNRRGSLPYHKDNVWQMYHMLRDNGFRSRNIKVFFANGVDGGIAVSGEEPPQTVFPAVMKSAMRSHLQSLCSSHHCVDSLVLYMNSPARSDGTSLLWDKNHDGIASEKEYYSVTELMSDLEECQAKQVHVIVDQSFSGEITRAFKRSRNHKNVVVYASCRDDQYSWGNHFTRAWTQRNHTHTCAKRIFRDAKKVASISTPNMYWGQDASNLNIFGAPCDVSPPFTKRELHQNYLGCQNLPTALWVGKFLKHKQNPYPHTDVGAPANYPGLELHDRSGHNT